MSDDLRRAMEAAAGPATAPPVDDVWRSGHRRRSRRRWAAMGGSMAALVLASGIALRVARSDDAESVRADAVPATCDPGPAPQTEFLLSADGVSSWEPSQAPRTAAAMVHGGGSEHLLPPDVVARVRVLDTGRVSKASTERRSEVEVIDPVFGAKAGDRLTVSDLGAGRILVDLERADRQIQREVAEVQAEFDEIDRPLAVLDGRIRDTAPSDQAYAGLMEERQQLKNQTDPERIALQRKRDDLQQRLEVLQLSERISTTRAEGTACHRFAVGDDLIVALARQGGSKRYELTGPSSFFLVDGDGFSEELDAARRSVDGWGDSPLLELARRSTPDEFLDDLRRAKDD